MNRLKLLNDIQRLARQGFSAREAGEKLGVGKNVVMGLAYRNGIYFTQRPYSVSGKRWTNADVKTLVTYRQSGKPWSFISVALDRSVDAVQRKAYVLKKKSA